MPINGAKCLPPDGRLFHPKVYLFETGSGMSAVVGSHNLTGGAFGGKNIEVSVLIEGGADEKVFADLQSFVMRRSGVRFISPAPIDIRVCCYENRSKPFFFCGVVGNL